MSTGTRLPWMKAAGIAQTLTHALAPAVVRSKVVGSLRRRRQFVGDIEFILEPRFSRNLLNEPVPEIEPIRRIAESWGMIVKGGDRMIQVQLHRPDVGDLKVDLFMVHPPASWWSILAIRTGPADLGAAAVTRMRKYGLRHDGGRILRQDDTELPLEREEDFFEAARMPYLLPHQRDNWRAHLALAAT